MLRVVGSLRPSFRRSRAGVVAIPSGKLCATAKRIKPSKTLEGEVLRMDTLVLGEIIAEGVENFSPKPNKSRTAKADRREAKSPTGDAIFHLEKRAAAAGAPQSSRENGGGLRP